MTTKGGDPRKSRGEKCRVRRWRKKIRNVMSLSECGVLCWRYMVGVVECRDIGTAWNVYLVLDSYFI